MKSLSDYRFAFVDLETTGGSAARDRITEAAVIGVENATVIETWSQLLNPGVAIPQFIQRFTGITPLMVADQPGFDEVAEDLSRLLDERILVAHNVRFDYSFLRAAFKGWGQDYAPRMLCTVKLSRFLNPDRPTHKLDHLMQVYGLACRNRHRALDDAQLLWMLMKCWVEEHGMERLIEGIERVLKRPALPALLDPQCIDALPQAPGVYLFYGMNDTPLYIGKSINIRSRVLAHFSADHRDTREMTLAQQVIRIDHQRTAGDLGAQLLESRLIKQLHPLYNRRLRKQKKLTYFLLETDHQGYVNLKLNQSDSLPDNAPGRVVGLFKSKYAAQQKLREWAALEGLCQRKLGLEKGSTGSCFAYQLNKCRGACCGQETAPEYNARLETILHAWQLKVWPFKQAIVYTECGADQTDYHLIDQWCQIDTQKTPQLLNLKPEQPRTFDLDTYKILLKVLDNDNSRGCVEILSRISSR